MATLESLLDSCPGLCGEIARSINGANKYDQPGAALAAALSFCAMLKCGRIVSPSGIEPNLYTCIIADSGTGKSQVQKSLTEIIELSELSDPLLGKPASDAGLLKALSQKSRKLLIWDEFGIALQELSQSKTGYRAMILSLIMDLFSAAGRTYIGKEYATQSRTNLESPYLNIFSASTPNRFFGSLDENFVDDGFLSRWLIFFSSEIKRNNNYSPVTFSTSMKNAIAFLEEWYPVKKPGNLSSIIGEVEKRKVAFQSLDNYKIAMRGLDAKSENAKNSLERIFWSRSAELYTKVCLAVCEADRVTMQDAYFSDELVRLCIATQIEQCHARLGENDQIRAKNKVYDLIKPGERLTSKQVHDRMRKLKLSEFEKRQLIETLVENEVWQLEQIPVENSRKKSKFYSLLSQTIQSSKIEVDELPF